MTSTLWRPPPLGPGGRPFRGLRTPVLLLSLAAGAVNAIILLSDRAPGLLSRVSARIDAGVNRAAGATGVDVPGTTVGVPRSDFDIHVLIWAVAALLVGLAMWSWASLVLGSAGVLAASATLEFAQQEYSRLRTVQLHDLVANTLGVATGACAVVAFAVGWRLFVNRGSARLRRC